MKNLVRSPVLTSTCHCLACLIMLIPNDPTELMCYIGGMTIVVEACFYFMPFSACPLVVLAANPTWIFTALSQSAGHYNLRNLFPPPSGNFLPLIKGSVKCSLIFRPATLTPSSQLMLIFGCVVKWSFSLATQNKLYAYDR